MKRIFLCTKVHWDGKINMSPSAQQILEAHIHANPKPKITWLCNGDFVKESERKHSKLEPRIGEKNKWNATLTIIVSFVMFVLSPQLRFVSALLLHLPKGMIKVPSTSRKALIFKSSCSLTNCNSKPIKRVYDTVRFLLSKMFHHFLFNLLLSKPYCQPFI